MNRLDVPAPYGEAICNSLLVIMFISVPRRTMTLGSRILIYNDIGSERTNVLRQSVLKSLAVLKLQSISVEFIDAARILSDKTWTQKTRLLIMPGGRDLPYARRLNGPGNNAIKDFVNGGGHYFGICAGAYYASMYCEFERGTKLEVCGTRELSFFPGVARGSVFPGHDYASAVGARVVDLSITDKLKESTYIGDEDNTQVYFDGGCEFLVDQNANISTQTLAYYSDTNKIAIATCRVGQGMVLVSGVHPEMDYEFLEHDNYSRQQWDSLIKSVNSQRKLFTSLLEIALQ